MKTIKTLDCRALRRGVAALLLLTVSVAANAYNFESGGIYYNISSSSNKTCEVTYQSYANYTYTSDYSGNVVIPETVTYNGTTYTITAIGSSAFRGCSGLTSVIIPNSVTTIGEWAFSYCTGLTSIYSLNPELPTCSYNGVFYNVDTSSCTLYVPTGSKEAYSTADQWEDFLNIEEMDMTPVNGIMADGNADVLGYYTLDGKQVPTLQRGINIIRYSDGTARKVLVK